MATVYGWVDEYVAHLGGVRRTVAGHGDDLAARARARLAAHRETGAASIDVDHGAVDTVVSLVDPAALSIEFGRGGYVRGDGVHVGPMDGLHILTGLL